MFLRLTSVSQMDPGSRDLDFVILIYPSPTYLGGKSYLVAMGVYQGIVSHTQHARAIRVVARLEPQRSHLL